MKGMLLVVAFTVQVSARSHNLKMVCTEDSSEAHSRKLLKWTFSSKTIEEVCSIQLPPQYTGVQLIPEQFHPSRSH